MRKSHEGRADGRRSKRGGALGGIQQGDFNNRTFPRETIGRERVLEYYS